MKLTTKLKAEILKVYNAYWDSYFKGDMRAFASLLHENVQLIGSSENEVFSDKRSAMRFYEATAGQVAGKAAVQNRKITMRPVDNNVLVIEKSDFYVLIDDEWTFYGHGRISTLLQKTGKGWKIIHEHGSLPDSKAGEGEQVNTERIKAENRELREAVKRRTIELEHKNRELEIETALERVRAVAMGMKEPADMLEVCKTISLQLESLDVKEIRNVQTAIFYESRSTYMNYEYYSRHQKTIITETSYTNHKVHKAFATKMLKGKSEVFITHIKGKKVKDWIAYQKTTNVFIDRFLEKASSLNYYWHSLGLVALGISTYVPLSKEDLSLFKRFLNVFELAYTRYLDIEQAHAQARESQMQASLEKVRAQALGMRKPEDLPDVCEVLFKELQTLGFSELRNTMVNIHNDEQRTFLNYDYSDEIGKSITPLHYNIHPVIEKQIQQIRSARDAFSETVFTGKDLAEWKQFRRRSGEKDDPRIKSIAALHYYLYSIGTGSIGISTFSSIGEEKLELLKRFRNVFDFAYRRYMDVAQAETQAKEARIEAALERVRAQAMSMRKSEELLNVCESVFRQLQALGFSDDILRNSQIVINQDEKGFYHGYQYSDYAGAEFAVVPYDLHPVIKFLSDKLRQSSEAFADIAITGQSLDDWRSFVNSFPQKHDDKLNAASELHYYFYSVGIGALGISTFESITERQLEILKRFRNVFDLSYKRYTDIALAEGQAREAQIQLALERVRARTMAMQKSEELAETAAVLFQQLKEIDKAPKMLTIGIMNEKEGLIEFWVTDWSGDGSKVNRKFDASIEEPVLLNKIFAAWKEQRKSTVIELVGKKLQDWIDYRVRLSGIPDDNDYSSKRGFVIAAFFSKGMLSISAYEPRPPETVQLLERFAGVFDLTYTRFLDLQKAEAQAREAQIEASLERVRSKAMAMHTSGDLSVTVSAVFSELRKLGIETIRTGVALYSKDRPAPVYYASTTAGDDALTITGSPNPSSHPCLALQHAAWQKQQNYFPVLSEAELKAYYDVLFLQPSAQGEAGVPFQHSEYGYYLPFSEGNFYAWSLKPFNEDEINSLARFKTIVDLTFRRYFDLEKAEAQAREARIEASLERVRSRTLAMQKSDELAETSAVLFRQLIALGINPNRLYIAIIKDDDGNVEFWITDEDGSKVNSAFTANLQHNRSWKKMFDGWRREEKSLTIDMQGEELQEYFSHLNSLNVPFKGGLSQKRRVQSVAYFSKGFIGMASPDEQPEETTPLLERFAAVFNLTFTRFNDLKLAEAQAHQAHLDLIQLQTEKKRAEDALSELSATQAQLIQQEKLASLGQLTAGIAHEIKNPLNFVNNFSSVSLEMLDEVLEEIRGSAPELIKGETPQLLGNIKTNLAKIMEHGARADSIVKSMLQHSRGGARRMEPTDLNTLIKEFVNLAFHGMRASKNPINVNIELALDQSTGKVSLIAEDFSRVILNLSQNAFDAMREKLNAGEGKSYLPKLTVRTRRELNRVVVQIEDNGPGIPDTIKDKVLQPFFTTKKGTQGTGLGLSITNDIVKAHRGEMKVETNSSGGATFTIGLPIESEA